MDRSETAATAVNDGQPLLKKDVSGHYRLEPHVCRTCFARVASTEVINPDLSITRRYVCTSCGAEANGTQPSVLCCCGIRMRKTLENGKPGNEMIDAGIRCHANENVRPDFPALFVASYRGGSD